jgi:hypothetical protein
MKKVNGLNDASSDRRLFLENERYDKILREVKEAQILRKNNQSLTSKHHRRLKICDVMKIGDTEKLTEGGSGENDSKIGYYCNTEELFDILQATHINLGHKWTTHCFLYDLQKHSFHLSQNSCSFLSVMEAKRKKKFLNFTRQVIDFLLTLCEQCQLKKKYTETGIRCTSSPVRLH